MRLSKSLLLATLSILLATLPLHIEARAGGYGGRGGSYSSPHIHAPRGGGYSSSPFYSAPSYNQPNRSPYGPSPYAAAPSAVSHGGFFSGLFSGIAGSWLYNHFFHSTPAATNQPANTAGTAAAPANTQAGAGTWLFRIILILLIIYFIRRMMRNRAIRQDQNRYQSSVSSDRNQPFGSNQPLGAGGSQQVNLGPADYSAFGGILIGIQSAWSQNHLNELQRLTTPDMYNYFISVLDQNRSSGLTNHVEQIVLQDQEVQDTWQEGDAMYARVKLTWSAIDYTTNEQNNAIVEGDPRTPTTVTELWTFVRYTNRQWQLAEIAQV